MLNAVALHPSLLGAMPAKGRVLQRPWTKAPHWGYRESLNLRGKLGPRVTSIKCGKMEVISQRLMNNICVSYCCYKKNNLSLSVKTTQIYYITALEVKKNLK